MFSTFLSGALGRAGMSARPEFYSGRPATTSDLNSAKLEKLHHDITANVGEKAGEAFIDMVAAIPVLTATDFLVTLVAFEGNDYAWDKSLLSRVRGVYAVDEGTALGTVVSRLGPGRERDDTYSIRAEFLRKHGREVPHNDSPYIMYGRSPR